MRRIRVLEEALHENVEISSLTAIELQMRDVAAQIHMLLNLLVPSNWPTDCQFAVN